MSRMEHVFHQLKALLEAHAQPDKARHMARYMKDQFSFYGIHTPERKALLRQCLYEQGMLPADDLPAFFRLCFEQEQREWQYVVNDLGQRAGKAVDLSFLPLFEELIARKSWWDTVDFLSPKLSGRLLLRYPDALATLARRWIAHPDFWYQRAALLLQLDYKAQTNGALLFELVRQRADSPEFFVQKAAGWALRQYSRVDARAVSSFLDRTEVAPLTRREGLKWINAQDRP